jgi:hypothetical protein
MYHDLSYCYGFWSFVAIRVRVDLEDSQLLRFRSSSSNVESASYSSQCGVTTDRCWDRSHYAAGRAVDSNTAAIAWSLMQSPWAIFNPSLTLPVLT